MRRGTGVLLGLAVIVAALAGAPTAARARNETFCPPDARLVPTGRDGAGNPVSAYYAAAPQIGTYDPYAGRSAPDPQASPTGGPEQHIPRTR